MQNEIQNTITAIKAGGVAVFPADVGWCIGCDPTDAAALARVFQLSGTEEGKPLPILIGEIGQLYDYVVQIPEIAWDIVEWSEIPLTIIYPKGKFVAKEALGKDDCIAVRLVSDGFVHQLVRKHRKGIAAVPLTKGDTLQLLLNEKNGGVLTEMDYVVSSKSEKESSFRADRIIELGLNGAYKTIKS